MNPKKRYRVQAKARRLRENLRGMSDREVAVAAEYTKDFRRFYAKGGNPNDWSFIGDRPYTGKSKRRGKHAKAHLRKTIKKLKARRSHVLTAARRRKLDRRFFALPDRRLIPVPDLAHVGPARARLKQMRKKGSVTKAEFKAAWGRILFLQRGLTRKRHARDPMSGIGKTGDDAVWKKRKTARQWGVFIDGGLFEEPTGTFRPYAWYGDKGQALDAARELRRQYPSSKVDVRSKSVRTLRLGYLYRRKGHGRQKETSMGTAKYLHGSRYVYGEPYGYPGKPRKKTWKPSFKRK